MTNLKWASAYTTTILITMSIVKYRIYNTLKLKVTKWKYFALPLVISFFYCSTKYYLHLKKLDVKYTPVFHFNKSIRSSIKLKKDKETNEKTNEKKTIEKANEKISI